MHNTYSDPRADKFPEMVRRENEKFRKEEEQLRKLRERKEANDKYNPWCPYCHKRVLYSVYGLVPGKIDSFERRKIMYIKMGCLKPEPSYTYYCPDCKIGYSRKMKPIE